MRVAREPVNGITVERLVVVEPDRDDDHYVGETAGYKCAECHQLDETLDQIWHTDTCDLAGDHGRRHYDELVPDREADNREFHADTEIVVLEAADTGDTTDGPRNGEVIGFVCEHCGNGDEDLFEIVHDEACPLADTDASARAGRHEEPVGGDVVADGGCSG